MFVLFILFVFSFLIGVTGGYWGRTCGAYWGLLGNSPFSILHFAFCISLRFPF